MEETVKVAVQVNGKLARHDRARPWRGQGPSRDGSAGIAQCRRRHERPAAQARHRGARQDREPGGLRPPRVRRHEPPPRPAPRARPARRLRLPAFAQGDRGQGRRARGARRGRGAEPHRTRRLSGARRLARAAQPDRHAGAAPLPPGGQPQAAHELARHPARQHRDPLQPHAGRPLQPARRQQRPGPLSRTDPADRELNRSARPMPSSPPSSMPSAVPRARSAPTSAPSSRSTSPARRRRTSAPAPAPPPAPAPS